MIVRMFELIIFLFQKQNLSPRVTGPPEPDPKRRNPATNGRTRRDEEDGEVDTTSTARAGARLRAGPAGVITRSADRRSLQRFGPLVS